MSSVNNMNHMFWAATLFNCNISKWDVSRVANMNGMFMGAKSFNQQLYGFTWVHSMATKTRMFEGSSGSILWASIYSHCVYRD